MFKALSRHLEPANTCQCKRGDELTFQGEPPGQRGRCLGGTQCADSLVCGRLHGVILLCPNRAKLVAPGRTGAFDADGMNAKRQGRRSYQCRGLRNRGCTSWQRRQASSVLRCGRLRQNGFLRPQTSVMSDPGATVTDIILTSARCDTSLLDVPRSAIFFKYKTFITFNMLQQQKGKIKVQTVKGSGAVPTANLNLLQGPTTAGSLPYSHCIAWRVS